MIYTFIPTPILKKRKGKVLRRTFNSFLSIFLFQTKKYVQVSLSHSKVLTTLRWFSKEHQFKIEQTIHKETSGHKPK